MADPKLVDSVEYQLAIGNRADVMSKAAGASLIALVKQAIDDIDNAIGADATDVIGELTDVADETVDTATLVAMHRASLGNRAVPRIARKAYTFNATAIGTYAIFTVTGAVKVKLYAICTTLLTPTVAGATVSLGVVGTVAQFIAATLAADLAAGGRLWYDATPTTVIDLDSVVSAGIMAKTVIGNGADIVIAVAAQAITSGVIEFMCEWEPITADGNVVAV